MYGIDRGPNKKRVGLIVHKGLAGLSFSHWITAQKPPPVPLLPKRKKRNIIYEYSRRVVGGDKIWQKALIFSNGYFTADGRNLHLPPSCYPARSVPGSAVTSEERAQRRWKGSNWLQACFHCSSVFVWHWWWSSSLDLAKAGQTGFRSCCVHQTRALASRPSLTTPLKSYWLQIYTVYIYEAPTRS